MNTANFFVESQAQFSEAQKQFAQVWDESQKQLFEAQKQLLNIWMSSIPSTSTQGMVSESFEKTQNFQREVINSALNAQQATANLAIETQKKFWDNYFQATQKMMQQTSGS